MIYKAFYLSSFPQTHTAFQGRRGSSREGRDPHTACHGLQFPADVREEHRPGDQQVGVAITTVYEHAVMSLFFPLSLPLSLSPLLSPYRLYLMQQEEGEEDKKELEILKCPQTLV